MGRPPVPIGEHGRITVGAEVLDPATGRWSRAPEVPAPRAGDGAAARWSARCRVRDLDGRVRQVRVSAPTATAAQDRLLVALAARTAPPGEAVTGMTSIEDLAATWLAEVAASGVRPSTRDLYRRSVAAHLVRRLGLFPVRLVNPGVVDMWLGEVAAAHGAAAARTATTCLRGVLRLAVQRGAIAADPLEHATPRARVEPKSAPGPLSAAEERRLREHLAADPSARSHGLDDLVLLLLGTGCRVGEALALTWDAVDLTPGAERVAFTATVERVAGQPSRVREQARGGRTGVPLDAEVAGLLRERLAARPPRRARLVFPTSTGTVADPANTQKRLRRLFDAAGLAGVVSHALRATRAARLRDAGAPAHEVARQLGLAVVPAPRGAGQRPGSGVAEAAAPRGSRPSRSSVVRSSE